MRFLLILCLCAPASAATLRHYAELAGGTVHVSDLWSDLRTTKDAALGPAPAPGQRIEVGSAQLAAIARDFGVEWRPLSGAERAVLVRRGVPLSRDALLQVLAPALEQAGAPEGAEIDLPGFEPPVVAEGAPSIEVGSLDYGAATGRFSAVLRIVQRDAEPVQFRVGGSVVPMQRVAVLAHAVRQGAVLAAEDVSEARVRATAIRGTPVAAARAVGHVLRRTLLPGQPVTEDALGSKPLVARLGLVRMVLESGGLRLAAQGVAQEEAGLGERVRVENPSSHVIVEAMVTGEGEVRVVPAAGIVAVAAE